MRLHVSVVRSGRKTRARGAFAVLPAGVHTPLSAGRIRAVCQPFAPVAHASALYHLRILGNVRARGSTACPALSFGHLRLPDGCRPAASRDDICCDFVSSPGPCLGRPSGAQRAPAQGESSPGGGACGGGGHRHSVSDDRRRHSWRMRCTCGSRPRCLYYVCHHLETSSRERSQRFRRRVGRLPQVCQGRLVGSHLSDRCCQYIGICRRRFQDFRGLPRRPRWLASASCSEPLVFYEMQISQWIGDTRHGVAVKAYALTRVSPTQVSFGAYRSRRPPQHPCPSQCRDRRAIAYHC